MVKFQSVMNKNDVIFHMQAKAGYIVTYGDSTAEIENHDVDIFASSFHNQQVFKASNDSSKGIIALNDNLYSKVLTTKQYSISYWCLINEMKDNISFFLKCY